MGRKRERKKEENNFFKVKKKEKINKLRIERIEIN